MILKGLTALEYIGQVKIFKNCTQDSSGPDERAQAWRENHKSGDCSDSPIIIFPKNDAGRTKYTRITDCEHHERGGGGGSIGRYSTMTADTCWTSCTTHRRMDSRLMNWKGTDGTQAKSMKRRAPGTKWVFVRSQENGLSLALGSGIWCLPRSIAGCLSDAVMGVLYARSDVAHTDPSSVIVDCGMCHTLFCEWTDGSHSVWMDRFGD